MNSSSNILEFSTSIFKLSKMKVIGFLLRLYEVLWALRTLGMEKVLYKAWDEQLSSILFSLLYTDSIHFIVIIHLRHTKCNTREDLLSKFWHLIRGVVSFVVETNLLQGKQKLESFLFSTKCQIKYLIWEEVFLRDFRMQMAYWCTSVL